MLKLKLILGIACLALVGCSTAGPYVTNISSDGRGNLIIEKQKVQYNSFLRTVTNGESTTTNIKVIPEDKWKDW